LTILYCLLALAAVVKGTLFLFAYLNNQVFPHPLAEEEEKQCLEDYRQGNEEARNKLIEHNLRLWPMW
jgi:RNA polymerase sporulation-specific sigma factor